MKMNGQSRSFAKQVQVDLVALGDADLCNMVQQWIDGSHSSEGALDVSEGTRLALGYTRAFPGVRPPAHQHADVPGATMMKGRSTGMRRPRSSCAPSSSPWMCLRLLSTSSPSPTTRCIQPIPNGTTA